VQIQGSSLAACIQSSSDAKSAMHYLEILETQLLLLSNNPATHNTSRNLLIPSAENGLHDGSLQETLALALTALDAMSLEQACKALYLFIPVSWYTF
jgi:hypothetical protein